MIKQFLSAVTMVCLAPVAIAQFNIGLTKEDISQSSLMVVPVVATYSSMRDSHEPIISTVVCTAVDAGDFPEPNAVAQAAPLTRSDTVLEPTTLVKQSTTPSLLVFIDLDGNGAGVNFNAAANAIERVQIIHDTLGTDFDLDGGILAYDYDNTYRVLPQQAGDCPGVQTTLELFCGVDICVEELL